MAHFINPINEGQCLALTYTGELAPLEVVAARYAITEMLETKHWNRLMMDVTSLSATQTALVLFDLAGGAFAGVPHNTRIAIVVQPEEVRRARILETPPQEKGVAIAIFKDASNATRWLQTNTSKV
jgi:hypothetical protein